MTLLTWLYNGYVCYFATSANRTGIASKKTKTDKFFLPVSGSYQVALRVVPTAGGASSLVITFPELAGGVLGTSAPLCLGAILAVAVFARAGLVSGFEGSSF